LLTQHNIFSTRRRTTACKVFLWNFENCTLGYKAFGSFCENGESRALKKLPNFHRKECECRWLKTCIQEYKFKQSNLTFTVCRKFLLNELLEIFSTVLKSASNTAFRTQLSFVILTLSESFQGTTIKCKTPFLKMAAGSDYIVAKFVASYE
jgi:hypothetical protein